MRAAASDALVQRTLHPPRIPWKPAAAGQSGGSLTAGSGQASTSGARQAQKQSSSSSPSGQSGQRKKKGKDSPPPLSRTLVSFLTYRAGSPRAQALRQEVTLSYNELQ